MLKKQKQRLVNLFLALGCISATFVANLFFGKKILLTACPYGVLENTVLGLLSFIFFLIFLHNPKTIGGRIYSILILIVTGLGLCLSGYHSWLQLQSSYNQGTIKELVLFVSEQFGSEFFKSISIALEECSEIEWYLVGLSLPMWLFILFIIIGGVGFINNWRYIEYEDPYIRGRL